MYLGCWRAYMLCLSYLVQYDGVALHCLLPFFAVPVSSYSVVTTELVPLEDESTHQHGQGGCWVSTGRKLIL